MHLIIYFSGTEIVGEYDEGKMAEFKDVEGVSTISVRGCAHEEVCKSSLFPDLEKFAGRFVGSVFKTDEIGNKLRLTDTPLGDLKVGIRANGTNVEKQQLLSSLDKPRLLSDLDEPYPLDVTRITLVGTSRGGVTCFNIARELQKIAPNIPVDIVANQPVPGNISPAPGSIAATVEDCTDLKNVKNASIILGTYTEDRYTKENIQAGIARKIVINTYNRILGVKDNRIKDEAYYLVMGAGQAPGILDDLKNDGLTESVIKKMKTLEEMAEKSGVEKSFKSLRYSIEWDIASLTAGIFNFGLKAFFSQIVPKLPKETDQKITVIPEIGHDGGFNQLQLGVAKSLHKCGLVNEKFVESKENVVIDEYSRSNNVFPINNAIQKVFGMNQEMLSQHFDELHPKPNRRRGYEFEENQSLMDWWKIQDKKASHFSTPITKALVNIIAKTNPDDKASLGRLYAACEKWLITKSDGISSRYGQVTALRNEIYDRLLNQHAVPKKALIDLKEEIHHKHQFLQKEWSSRSSYTSFFKSTMTKDLDKAFKDHAKETQSESNDRKLLKAMDDWLGAKDKSVSKRYDLVLEMRNKLEESINTRYPNPTNTTAEEPGHDQRSISNTR